MTVGALGAFLDFGLLAALKAIGLPTLPANSISFSAAWGYAPAKIVATGVAVFWNYFANRNWAFR